MTIEQFCSSSTHSMRQFSAQYAPGTHKPLFDWVEAFEIWKAR